MQNLWTQVDEYLEHQLLSPDKVLEQVLSNNKEAGLPVHDVAPNQGKLLNLLVQITGARRVLEIGTLGGYSSIWMARALPKDGKLITLEADSHHAEVAQRNFLLAGLSDKIEIRKGLAADILPALKQNGPFDLIFIDADKPNNPVYIKQSLALAKVGTLIIGDNVIREGAIIDDNSDDVKVQGVRSFFDIIKNEERLSATALQTVGCKGYDGFVIARVIS